MVMDHYGSEDLTGIVQDSDVVLIDNSVLCGPLPERNTLRGRNRRVDGIGWELYYSLLFNLARSSETLCTTVSMVEEGLGGKCFPYKKLLKSRHAQRDSEFRFRIRSIRDLVKARRGFLRYLEDSRRTLNFGAEEDLSYMDMLSLTGDFFERFGVSYVDVDLVTSGAALAYEGLRVAILSNDFGIVSSWNSLLDRVPELKQGKFSFYAMRRSFGEFDRIFPNSAYLAKRAS